MRPVFKTVDTCAGEFPARTPYHFSTYEDETEVRPAARPRIVILGAGPNRIGQGIEFARLPAPTIRWTVATRVASGLREIAVPARVCFGTRDVMLGAFTAPRFAAAIPQADLVPLPGCGHVPMADAPDRVARAITEVTAPG